MTDPQLSEWMPDLTGADAYGHLDPAALRLTLIGADGAVEYQGCTLS